MIGIFIMRVCKAVDHREREGRLGRHADGLRSGGDTILPGRSGPSVKIISVKIIGARPRAPAPTVRMVGNPNRR